jgi:DNA repair ATPase RecN
MFVNRITNTILNSLFIERMSSDRYKKMCDYKTEKTPKIILPNSPPHISLDKIKKMTNKYQLLELEKNYDEFLDKYIHLMLLYDNIDEYLETRDLITMRISQLKRMEQRQGNDDICISGRQSRILPTVQNNTKSHSYYFALKKKEEFLESELKKVKKELKTIKKNSLL